MQAIGVRSDPRQLDDFVSAQRSHERSPYLGCMRIAPSMRMHSPFM